MYGLSCDGDAPLAPLRLQAHGVDPGTRYWLRATPVTLEASRDDVRVGGAVAGLAREEAAALVGALNAHFAGDGIAFHDVQPDTWFLDIGDAAPPRTRALARALDRPLRGILPGDAGATPWRRWLHEIEMLLAAHPVNDARARAARPAANGVWLSEGGRMPSPHGAAPIATWGDDDIAAPLAQRAGLPPRGVPEALDVVLAAHDDAAAVLLASAPASWLELERRWAAPAWRALGDGRLDRLLLIGERDDASAVRWTVPAPRWIDRARLALAKPALAPLLARLRET